MSSYITRIKNQDFDKWFTVNLEIQELPESILCAEAKLLHTYLASRPQNWEYKKTAATKLLGSSYRVDKAISELKEIGLLEITAIREKGRFMGHDWRVKMDLNEKFKSKASRLIEDEIPSHENDSPENDKPESESPQHDNRNALKEIPLLEEKTFLKEQPLSDSDESDCLDREENVIEPKTKKNKTANTKRQKKEKPPKEQVDIWIDELCKIYPADRRPNSKKLVRAKLEDLKDFNEKKIELNQEVINKIAEAVKVHDELYWQKMPESERRFIPRLENFIGKNYWIHDIEVIKRKCLSEGSKYGKSTARSNFESVAQVFQKNRDEEENQAERELEAEFGSDWRKRIASGELDMQKLLGEGK